MNLRIANGKLITGSEIVQKDILVRDGKIEAIVDRNAETSDDYVTVDCAGNYDDQKIFDFLAYLGRFADSSLRELPISYFTRAGRKSPWVKGCKTNSRQYAWASSRGQIYLSRAGRRAEAREYKGV